MHQLQSAKLGGETWDL